MEHKEKILRYYNATYIDYRALWTGKSDRAVHFGYYDSKATKHRDALLRLNAVLADSVHITEKDNVLDAGCGYGGSAMWLAENIGCDVIGITLVPPQVLKGQRYVKERNLEGKVNILEMDFTQTIFPDEAFDVYWAIESLVHTEDRQKVFDEAFRILKKDGRIAIAEFTLREHPPLSNSEREYMKPWTSGWAMPSLLTPTELRDGLLKSGFSNIKVTDVTPHIKPSLRRLEVLSILNFPIAILIAPFFFRRERLENYYGSWRQISALRKELWTYSIVTAQKK